MSGVLVLGVGSPFGADTLGWRVAEILEGELRHRHGWREAVHLRREDRPGLRLIELIRPYDHVILIDAIVAQGGPETLYHLQKDALLDFHATPSTHAAGIAEALALGAALGDLPAMVELFGLSVEPATPPPPGTVQKLASAVIAHLEACLD